MTNRWKKTILIALIILFLKNFKNKHLISKPNFIFLSFHILKDLNSIENIREDFFRFFSREESFSPTD